MQPTAADLALEAAAIAVSRPARVRRPKQPGLVAVIVESRRDGGQPRQHLIKYVAAIRCSEVTTLAGRSLFWIRAAKALSGFDGPERALMERTLEARVPRPTAEETEALLNRGLTKGTADVFAAARARMAAWKAGREN